LLRIRTVGLEKFSLTICNCQEEGAERRGRLKWQQSIKEKRQAVNRSGNGCENGSQSRKFPASCWR